jgi:hypothetical protein
MARGGRRAGNKGQGYGNRTDLHSPLPVAAPTGLPYGARGEMVGEQRAVPMRPAPGPSAPAPTGAPGPVPGDAGDFLRPTERPNEPVTAGLPTGAGPGPEALSLMRPQNDPLTTAVAALNALGPAADKETSALRDAMNATLANRAAP